jgi:hypothetical protein
MVKFGVVTADTNGRNEGQETIHDQINYKVLADLFDYLSRCCIGRSVSVYAG